MPEPLLSCDQRVHHGRGLWSKAQRPRPQTIKNTSRALYTNKLSAQTTKIRIKLKLSHTLSTTGVQLVSKRGGLFFPWHLFSFGGGGG